MKVNIGKDIELDIDTTKLNESVMAHVVYIGLRNILMDSHAGVTPAVAGDTYRDQSKVTAEKKLAAMYAGEVRTTSGRTSDPVKARVNVIVDKMVKAAWRNAGRKLATLSDAAHDKIAATFDMAAIESTARAQVEAEKALNVELPEGL